MYGGLSPEINTLDKLRRIERPTDVPDTGIIFDLLWADPDEGIVGWQEGDRYDMAYSFGRDRVRAFLSKFGLSLVCRAKQIVEGGYDFFGDRCLVTIFSAPNYRCEFENAGGMMFV